MTTTKAEKKVEKTEYKEAPRQDDLRVAYEIHTLAQMMYGELALIHPWITPPTPVQSFEATKAWSPFAPGMGPAPPIPTHWPW